MTRSLALCVLLCVSGCRTSPAAAPPIDVEVYADLVCPWCFIGTERLEQAITDSGLAGRVVVKHRPFLLDATTPAEGVELREHLSRRTGRNADELFGPAIAQARQTGIPLDFTKVDRLWPTAGAHALVLAAKDPTAQRALKQQLFRAYFLEGVSLVDEAALTALAAPHGLSAAEVHTALSSPTARAEIERLDAEAHEQGVTSVPTFVFCGRTTVKGAQPKEALAAALQACAQPASP